MKLKILFLVIFHHIFANCLTISGDTTYKPINRGETSIFNKTLKVWTLNENLTLPSPSFFLLKNDSYEDFQGFQSGSHKVNFLPKNLHEKFPNLEWINLEDAGLLEIHKIEIENFNNLVILELMRNNIEELEENLFSQNFKLELIDLSHNKIKFIQISAFEGLEKLKILKLNNNECIKFDANEKNQIEKVIQHAERDCVNERVEMRKEIENIKEKLEKIVEKPPQADSLISHPDHQLFQSSPQNSEILLIIGLIQIVFVIFTFIILLMIFKMIKAQNKISNDSKVFASRKMTPHMMVESEKENQGVKEGLESIYEELDIYGRVGRGSLNEGFIGDEIQNKKKFETQKSEVQDYEWDELQYYTIVDVSKKIKAEK